MKHIEEREIELKVQIGGGREDEDREEEKRINIPLSIRSGSSSSLSSSTTILLFRGVPFPGLMLPAFSRVKMYVVPNRSSVSLKAKIKAGNQFLDS
jgi:hypothetical protein